MKRIGTLLLCTALAVLLSACGKAPAPRMYIEAAQLTEQEQNIIDLLAPTPAAPLYDFSLDDTVAHIQVNVYELIDGQWQPRNGSCDWALQDTNGRLVLSFEKIRNGLCVGIQSPQQQQHFSVSNDLPELEEGMGCATARLSSRTEVVYQQEIPLVVQILTTKNEIRTHGVDSFYHPEAFAQYGYEHIYAITVMFSQKPLSD